jgi:hypothetical protein
VNDIYNKTLLQYIKTQSLYITTVTAYKKNIIKKPIQVMGFIIKIAEMIPNKVLGFINKIVEVISRNHRDKEHR